MYVYFLSACFTFFYDSPNRGKYGKYAMAYALKCCLYRCTLIRMENDVRNTHIHSIYYIVSTQIRYVFVVYDKVWLVIGDCLQWS